MNIEQMQAVKTTKLKVEKLEAVINQLTKRLDALESLKSLPSANNFMRRKAVENVNG